MPAGYTRRMLRSALLLASACLLLIAPAQAQWKWKDAAGRVQYSDLPPPQGTLDKDILLRPASAQKAPIVVAPIATAPAASAPVPPAKTAPDKPAAKTDVDIEQKKREQDEKAAKLKDQQDKQRLAEQRRENCTRARDALRGLDGSQRVTRTNAQGERVFLDESQVAAEAQRARAVVASECR
jgi:hypothetical protein